MVLLCVSNVIEHLAIRKEPKRTTEKFTRRIPMIANSFAMFATKVLLSRDTCKITWIQGMDWNRPWSMPITYPTKSKYRSCRWSRRGGRGHGRGWQNPLFEVWTKFHYDGQCQKTLPYTPSIRRIVIAKMWILRWYFQKSRQFKWTSQNQTFNHPKNDEESDCAPINWHGVWKSQKKSHSTLRAKWSTFTRVDKKQSKMPKMVNFGEFWKI